MAGDNEFQSKMKQAAKGPGGQEHKTKPATLFGADAYDRQVGRETAQNDNAAISGSTGASNLQSYINVSKSATQGNQNFSVDSANKFTNNTRDQSNVNKQQNAGFSDQRINNNSNFANAQQDKAFAKNEGFAMNTTNNFINNAKDHREENTQLATQFANQSVSKYMNMNKGNQTTNTEALDRTIRNAPIVDKARSDVQGNNTYGDMYSYGRGGLPGYTQPSDPSKIEQPDFDKQSDKYTDQISKFKI